MQADQYDSIHYTTPKCNRAIDVIVYSCAFPMRSQTGIDLKRPKCKHQANTQQNQSFNKLHYDRLLPWVNSIQCHPLANPGIYFSSSLVMKVSLIWINSMTIFYYYLIWNCELGISSLHKKSISIWNWSLLIDFNLDQCKGLFSIDVAEKCLCHWSILIIPESMCKLRLMKTP